MIYNQFRIYQLIQDQIILQNIHIGNELVNSLVVIYAINGIVLALIIIGIVYMNIYENQQKVRHFKYLLTIPPAELGNNRYLRKFILKYCWVHSRYWYLILFKSNQIDIYWSFDLRDFLTIPSTIFETSLKSNF